MKNIVRTCIVAFIAFALYQGYGAIENGSLDSFLPEQTQTAENVPGHSIYGMKQADDPDGCQITKKSIVVNIDPDDYPGTAAHVDKAKRSGEAKILHIDREGADDNRSESLAGIETKDGYDRDEYPPAASLEGGAGASVEYVEAGDNRGAGSSMSHQLGDYCSGQAFIITTE